ncbi:MAG TPA: histidine kinase dimerization/phospho-acceptor domain-containing protein, partial [Aquihabitans sp.]|nr:histidine kinase dimerization/phospho-acceptor domain-containing protein [Aquihabitans sp.]
MSPAAAAQLAFAAEFAMFLVCVAGLASALRRGLLSTTSWARSALACGFLGLATASFLRGALIVPEPDRPLLLALRVASCLALAVGLVRWNGRRSAIALGLGVLAAFAAAGAVQADRVEVADGLRFVAATGFALALVSVARRAISARIGVDAALLVLGVVLVVAVAVSVTVSDNVEGEALRRYTARASSEAEAVTAQARAGLGPARLVSGVLAAERAAVLQRVAGGSSTPADVADLDAALGDLTSEQLLGIDDPVVVMAPGGVPVAAAPQDLATATRLALAGDAVVREAQEAGAERQGVAVIGREAFAVAAVPVVVRPAGRPQLIAGTVVVAQRLDDTYLRVLGSGGEDLAFALATPTRVVARTGGGLGEARVEAVARQVVDEGERPRQRTDERFVSAAPVLGADGRAVLAMVVMAPSDAAEDTQEALFRTLFVVALAAALVAVAIGIVVGERIGRGLVQLTHAAQRMQSGELDTRVDVRSGDELGVLGGAFTSMASSIRAKTDELRAVAAEEAAVRARLQAVIAGMGEALLAVDGDGVVIEANRAAEELLGVGRDRVVGRPAEEAISWRLLDGTASPLQPGDLLDGVPMAADLAVGDGTVPVVVTSGRLFGEGGADGGSVLVLRDVRREREVDDLKSSILANIGHELRTPLTPIKGYAGMLRDRRLDEDRTKAFATEIISGVDQLERVVRQLVTFATIAAGHLDVVRAEAPAEDLADALRGRWEPRLDDGHELQVEVADGTGTAWVDRALFDQAVDELIDNAVKYSPDGGPVVVRFAPAVVEGDGVDGVFDGAGRGADGGSAVGSSDGSDSSGGAVGDGDGDAEPASDGAVTVTVSDRGIGIPPERLAGLADPFTQADPSNTRQFNGLGLG